MPENEPSVLADLAESAFGPDVAEIYSNTYYMSVTDFDIRLAFGTLKSSANGTTSINRITTAVHLDYKLAKDLVKNMEKMIEIYEAVYGPADIIIR